MTTRTEFEVNFYAAEGSYNVDIGEGDLVRFGYYSVPDGVWIDPDTGFKARAYTDNNGNYILAFAGTEGDKDPYQDLASFGWGNGNQMLPIRDQNRLRVASVS